MLLHTHTHTFTFYILCTQKLLQTDAFLHRPFYTDICTHGPLTHRRFDTQTLLHMDTCAHKGSYTQRLFHTDFFTHKSFYTQTALRTDTLTHRFVYTQTLFHTDHFTHKHFYTQTLLHTNSVTERHSYTQTLLHAEAFTPGLFYADGFTQRRKIAILKCLPAATPRCGIKKVNCARRGSRSHCTESRCQLFWLRTQTVLLRGCDTEVWGSSNCWTQSIHGTPLTKTNVNRCEQ